MNDSTFIAQGAEARKAAYSKYMGISLLFGMILTTAGFLVPIIQEAFQAEDEDQIKVVAKKVINYSELSAPPPIDLDKPEPELLKIPPKAKQVKFIQPVAKKDEEVLDEEYIPTIEELDQSQVGAENVEGADSVDVGSLFEVSEPVPEVEEVFSIVEVMPGFEGGDAALLEYLSKNTDYPQIAKDAGIQGTVFIQFVIETDGSVGDVNIIRGVHSTLDAEAVRVIQAMPKWNPGRQNGRAVRVYYTIPIRFIIK